MHEVLVNRLGGLSLPRKSVVRLTDRPDMTLDVYRGRKTTIQQYNIMSLAFLLTVVGRCIPSFFLEITNYAATLVSSENSSISLENMDGTSITGDNINTASQ